MKKPVKLSRVRRALSLLDDWALPRQLRGESAMAGAAMSNGSRELRPRTEQADRVGPGVCPYCAVGCGLLIYAKDGRPIHVEGDPRSPINQGTLCPKGAATLGLLTAPERLAHVLYRAPHSERWERKPLDWAMERIAFLAKRTRDELRAHASRRQAREPHARHGLARRRHARQRGELPHQEALRRGPGHGVDREPGARMT